jgi:hypothetical protein
VCQRKAERVAERAWEVEEAWLRNPMVVRKLWIKARNRLEATELKDLSKLKIRKLPSKRWMARRQQWIKIRILEKVRRKLKKLKRKDSKRWMKERRVELQAKARAWKVQRRMRRRVKIAEMLIMMKVTNKKLHKIRGDNLQGQACRLLLAVLNPLWVEENLVLEKANPTSKALERARLQRSLERATKARSEDSRKRDSPYELLYYFDYQQLIFAWNIYF